MRRRILALILAVAACSVIAFFVPAAVAFRSATRRRDLLELQREGSVVASRIALTGTIDVAARRAQLPAGHDLAVYDATGHRTAGDGPDRADAVVLHGLSGEVDEGYVGGDLVVEVPVRPRPAGPMSIVRVREPPAETRGRFRTSLLLLGAAAVGVVAVAGLVGALFAWRLGRRVDHVREWATAVGPDPSTVPPPTGIGELDDLSAAVAEAHGRVQQLLQRERSFSSHVSHQLRTPVAAMRVAVETELAAPRADHTLVLSESLQALDRLESTIASLLALTRQPDREPVTVGLVQMLEQPAQRWAPLLQAAGRELLTEAQPVQVRIDESCVQHILDVLLENALLHGAGVVTLAAAVDSDDVTLEVRDEGSEGEHDDPFVERGAGSGHGIGLRLARSLAEATGGRLEQIRGPRTTFRLTIPAAH